MCSVAKPRNPINAMTWVGTGPGAGKLALDTRTGRVRYKVSELPLPPEEAKNRAFRLDKLELAGDPEGDLYTVVIDRDPRGDACDCKGFIYGKGKPCKHVLACRSLVATRRV